MPEGIGGDQIRSNVSRTQSLGQSVLSPLSDAPLQISVKDNLDDLDERIATNEAARAKRWCNFTAGTSPSINNSLGVTSVAHASTGVYTVTWNISANNPVGVVTVDNSAGVLVATINAGGGSSTVRVFTLGGTATDTGVSLHIVEFGS